VVTVLLAMTLAARHIIGADIGLTLVLGANLGSALNPLFEGARDPAARRVPLGNLINRLTGLALVLPVFPWLVRHADVLGPSPARALANFHTLFNLALAILFLPWIGAFARLVTRLLPGRQEDARPGAPLYLDRQARETPAVALALATRETLRMADTVEEMLQGLRAALTSPSREPISALKRLDDVLDRLNAAIKGYVLSIPSEALRPEDATRQVEVLTFATNLEHAGDLVDRNLLGVATRKMKRGVAFSPEGEADLVRLVDRLIANTRLAASLFVSRDPELARQLVAEKEAFRAIEQEAVQAHFERLRAGNANTVETSSLHLDALRDLKRVNSHLAEGAAYPLLQSAGELLPSRLRAVR
jgi:phosphate:Na+ symporter